MTPLLIALAALDFVWAKPGNTNLVTGTVGGNVPRYEDRLWLMEAVAEREALSRPTYASNAFATVVARTNRVWAGEITKTSPGDWDFLERYLLEDVTLATTPRIASFREKVWSNATETVVNNLSNVTVVSDCWLWQRTTNRLELAGITQTLTNGTVNVWTNRYDGWTVVSNALVKVTVTNESQTLGYADLCTTATARSMAESRKWLVFDAYPDAATFKGPYSRATLSNHFALVRATRRVMPQYVSHQVPTGNSNAVHNDYGTGYDNSATTREEGYSVTASASWEKTDRQTLSGSQWRSDDGYPTNRTDKWGESTIPFRMPLQAGTGLSAYMVDFGGAARMEKAHLFAQVSLAYRRHETGSHTTVGGWHTDAEVNDSWSATVMVPLGEVTREQGHANVTFGVDATEAYSTAFATVGKRMWTASDRASLVATIAGQNYYQDTSTTRINSGTRQTTITLTASIDTLWAILYAKPRTTMGDWGEYRD